MLRRATFVLALICGVFAVHAAEPNAYTQSIDAWRAARVARLTAPDGWLSLIGLDWLKSGANRIGSAPDNDLVLKAGPAHLGRIDWNGDSALRLTLDRNSGATVDGKAVHETVLVDDMHVKGDAAPTTVRFGSASFFVIDRDGRKGLRVKDSAAPARANFLGIDYFPIDPSWRVEADWVPFQPPHTLEMGSVIGTVDKVSVPGKAVFRRNGATFELQPMQEEPGGELFFVLADQTSGRQTYGAARFLYAKLPDGGLTKPGKVILDFNQAYNPPCAFTAFATCPLAPHENRLAIAVTAGEKTYRGSHH